MTASLQLLAWVPLLPLLGFLILTLTEGRLGRLPVAIIGAGSIGAAALLALLVSTSFVASGQDVFVLTVWQWMDVAGFQPAVRLYFDALAMVMVGVITGVGFLIHLYATGYMLEEEGYSRFFAYMNLFVFAMLMLVLGDNLLVLYLGWEGVGLCSYLLIGFFYTDPANGYAARKAFVVTRVGDTAMLFGLILLVREFGSLEIQTVLHAATSTWPDGAGIITLIALLLLGGAVGKSAQVPLQTWLPDAMAGPTPVSALIHAATMVTAGVYLIARLHEFYLLSPEAHMTVAAVGLVTLFIAAFGALTQTDLKRILAYSTMSQIGYMFFALGIGAWSAAVFHLMTHAFFKALLFLGAGSVILALHHEQDVFRMGGLWRKLPVPFICMLVGAAALAALPLTSGFYSKDLILHASYNYGPYGPWLWGVASLAAFVTALYSARMISLVFFGAEKTEPHYRSRLNMTLPLLVLAALALGGGWFGFDVVAPVLPAAGEGGEHSTWLVWVTACIPLAGVVLASVYYGVRGGGAPASLRHKLRQKPGDESPEEPAGPWRERPVAAFLRSGWGFDYVYDALLVKPFIGLARLIRGDPVDAGYAAIATLSRFLNKITAATQTGQLRWYAASMGVGLALVLILAVTVA